MMSDAKAGAGSKVWGAVGKTIAVLLGVIVLVTVVAAMAPMVINSFNGGINSIAWEMRNGANSAINMAIAISVFMTSWMSVIIKMMVYVLLFMGAGAIFKWAMDGLKGGGGGGGHH